MKREGENLGGDEYVCSIDCGSDLTDVYLSSNSSSCIH